MNVKFLSGITSVILLGVFYFAFQIEGKIIQPAAVINETLASPQSSQGDLDLTFNASVASLSNLVVNTVAAQPDGKVIVGGNFSVGGDAPHNGIVRLDAQGNIDSIFNGGNGAGGQSPEVYSVALQPDGKILVGGKFSVFNNVAINNLVRLNPDGSLDGAFNIGSGTLGTVRSVAVQPNGKILVGGDAQF